ncbi:MAG: AbrB/MazE/SpoVT family DNA-binding domain-containing protein [Euryarchaeota archaeon]|nr:AbrB/MazE/SpoVT family DNA-binding domain-containing protein [Euryarchaeota archaeon]
MKCPTCNADMVKRQIEWKKGIYVRADVCPKCKEEFIDLEEHERAMREYTTQNITKLKRNVIKLGSSLAIRIPKDIETSLGLKEKDSVEIFSTREGIVIKPKKVRV